MSAVETVERALTLARARLAEMPKYGLFISSVKQLEYLLSVLNGVDKDRSQLKTIIVGHFAVREFEESDTELASALKAAQFIASQMAKGLKVQ